MVNYGLNLNSKTCCQRSVDLFHEFSSSDSIYEDNVGCVPALRKHKISKHKRKKKHKRISKKIKVDLSEKYYDSVDCFDKSILWSKKSQVKPERSHYRLPLQTNNSKSTSKSPVLENLKIKCFTDNRYVMNSIFN